MSRSQQFQTTVKRQMTGPEASRSELPDRAPGSPPPKGRIAIVAHHGLNNLGDEIATEALVQNLQRLNPGSEIICFSMNPADTARRFGIPAFAVRPEAEPVAGSRATGPSVVVQEESVKTGKPRSALVGRLKRLPLAAQILAAVRELREFLSTIAREIAFMPVSQRRLRGTRMLIVAGSNQIVDLWGGPWGYPFTLLRWALQARLAGARLAFVSVGAGPVRHATSWWLIRRALATATFVSFRDEGSSRLVGENTGMPTSIVRPDMAYSHDELRRQPARRESAAQARTIAINPMPVNDPRYWPHADPAAYHRYVGVIAQLTQKLAAAGHRVVFFSTHPSDERVADDVRAGLPPGIAPETIRPREPAELASCIRQADVVIATRFHGILLALACERPVVGISYFRKSRELMAAAGQAAFAVDIDAVSADWCVAAVERLLADGNSVSAHLREHAARQRTELEDQYVEILRRCTTA